MSVRLSLFGGGLAFKAIHPVPASSSWRLVVLARPHSSSSANSPYVSPALPSNFVFREVPNPGRQAQTTAMSSRPLCVLLAWMLAKEPHLNKYRRFWFERGFDVLSIRTLPTHLLVPAIGARRNALALARFLTERRPRYDQVVVHAFSVGGFQLGQLFFMLEQQRKAGDTELANQIYGAVRGIIFDSPVYARQAAPGLANAITENPVLCAIIRNLIHLFLQATKRITMDRYLEIEELFFANPNHIPGILLYSLTDPVSSPDSNHAMYQRWKSNGVLTDQKCWSRSPHVLHFKAHTEEYTRMVDHFLARIDLSKAKPFVGQVQEQQQRQSE